jgi:hypothetical protein
MEVFTDKSVFLFCVSCHTKYPHTPKTVKLRVQLIIQKILFVYFEIFR